MPQGIGLAGGYGAGGAGIGLEKLIEQQLVRQQFEQLKRVQDEQARLARDRHAFDQQQFSYGQQRDTTLDARRARERSEDLTDREKERGIRRSEFDTEMQAREFDQDMGRKEKATDRAMRQQERQEDRAFQSSERAKDRAAMASRAAGGGGAKTTEQLDAVSEMVLQNPELLKDFTPTDRSRILGHIATNKEGALPNKRAESMRSMLDSSLSTIQRLKESPGMSGAVGAKGPTSLFGLMGKPMAGSDASNYVAHIDALKSQLTLPRMEMMRGLGAMSEREFKTLSDSATALNRDMSEAEFMRELGKIEATLTQAQQRMAGGGAAPGGGGPAVGEIRMINGQRARWDGKGWLPAQ